MSEQNIKKMIADVFEDIATGIETGGFAKKVRVGVTTIGSEHGEENVIKGAEIAQEKDPSIEVVLIGHKCDSKLKQYNVESDEEGYKVMEELLDSGEIDACVTMHYSFPIGVSTVGRVVTPAMGSEMTLATTTGTSSPHRVEAMVLNAIAGIITAKAMGNPEPTLGILNVDGARQVERALKEIDKGGYKIHFAESARADGGCVMRGNDLLMGTPDIMVTDTLTGNLLMKVFSSYVTGGSFEAHGYGYGPGIGSGYERLIYIISRASGYPVIANAIKYAAECVRGDIKNLIKDEYKKANKAGLEKVINDLEEASKKTSGPKEEVKAPAEEVTDGSIGGIDILEMEDAVQALWKEGIFASSGMGCTGPVVMVNSSKLDAAKKVLAKAGFMAEETPC
ncbi:MAG: glycine/sarcosine/betaine reductase complex component C subunit alpha [Ezakiella sp.]|uniref:glycine/sarcosine/betaine reductase complex component C subunit alpha n=1 Tax=Ezakiella sp. TaxID=1935205 RepID=UPI002974CE03|nr:glycine/sarcosine/betaine reductase complex component C subunit alpha [Ezakiella sp.]MDD7731782.1 glycine/sarcosine/betaine reductase complex component C subunit alpha [Eubacteriales bacterium]MDY6080068.1 glycine/sarcosine/betaine reductase complex component C subunit alpha [Ezakiella sp.]